MSLRISRKPASCNPPGGSATAVTIIVLCRDNAHELGQTLRSLEHAGLPNRAEILIADGSCTDCCQRVFDDWILSLANTSACAWKVHRVWMLPMGVYPAFNRSIAIATGDWLAFMNSGDVYLSGGLALLLDAATSAPASLRAVVGQAWVICPDTGVRWLTPDPAVERMSRWLKHMVPCHQAMLFARDFALRHSYPQHSGASGDRIVMRAALGKSSHFAYVKLPVCEHFLTGISSQPPSLSDVRQGFQPGRLSRSDRLALALKLLLAPAWPWRPLWMRTRSRLMGLLC